MREPVTTQERLKRALRIGPAIKLVWESCPGWTLCSLGLLVIQGVLPLVPLYLMKLIVDTITKSATMPDKSAALVRVGWLVGAAVLIAIVDAACRSFSKIVKENQSQTVTDRVQGIIYAKSIQMDLQYYEDPTYYDTLHRAQQEAPYRPQSIVDGLTRVGQNGISLCAVLGLLFSLNWVIGLVLFAAAVPEAIVRLKYARVFYHWQRKRAQTERQAWYLGWLLSGDEAAKEVRLFGLGGTLLSRFNDIRTTLRSERLRIVRDRSTAEVFSQTVAAAAIFGSLTYVALRAVRGLMTVGDLVMYFGVLQRGIVSMQQVMSDLGGLYEDNLFLSYLQEFLELSPQVKAPAKPAIVPCPMREGFRVRDMSFAYPSNGKTVLHNIEMELRPGETVALVGENGSGKTTLVKLLTRLYDPNSGVITFDSKDLRDYEPDQLRKQIAVVLQDFMHYHATVTENIWYGNVDIPPDLAKIREAARKAGIDDVLYNLPEGYGTMLGRMFDDASELSLGQWQKVALARAFARDAQVIILDEPTSVMDARAEYEFFSRFRELARDKATLLISHRFSTVKIADRIYVLENGRIIESGSHDELLEREGKYAQLYNLQAQCYR